MFDMQNAEMTHANRPRAAVAEYEFKIARGALRRALCVSSATNAGEVHPFTTHATEKNVNGTATASFQPE